MIDTPVDGFMIGALRAPTGPPKPRTCTRAEEPPSTSDLDPRKSRKFSTNSSKSDPDSAILPPAELMTFDLRCDRKIARHPMPILKSHVLHCQLHNYTHGPSTAYAHQYAIPHSFTNPASSVEMSATYTPKCPLINTPGCRPCRLNLCKFACNPNLDVFQEVAL